jgi:hypothetical protein
MSRPKIKNGIIKSYNLNRVTIDKIEIVSYRLKISSSSLIDKIIENLDENKLTIGIVNLEPKKEEVSKVTGNNL